MGDLRNENDANCTYEGENNVLLQQASNWLLNQKLLADKGNPVSSPLGSIDFLSDSQNILQLKFNCSTIEDTMKSESKNIYSLVIAIGFVILLLHLIILIKVCCSRFIIRFLCIRSIERIQVAGLLLS